MGITKGDGTARSFASLAANDSKADTDIDTVNEVAGTAATVGRTTMTDVARRAGAVADTFAVAEDEDEEE